MLKDFRVTLLQEIKVAITDSVSQSTATLSRKLDSYHDSLKGISDQVLWLTSELKDTTGKLEALSSQVAGNASDIQDLQKSCTSPSSGVGAVVLP